MRIALVHDYLREYGGAERVVEAIHEIWPEAPLYTSFVDWHSLGNHAYRFKDWDIRPSWVQNNWFVKKFHSPLRFLAPQIWKSFDLSGFDVVLSSSGWFMCRGVRTGTMAGPRPLRLSVSSGGQAAAARNTHGPLHVCYIHHPPRNLYGYATGSTVAKYWPVKAYAAIINFFLRHYDFETAQRVDYFIANSKETARRVKKFYRRESTVIYPPIDTKESGIKNRESGTETRKSTYFLSVGRLMWAKRVDLAVLASNRLKLRLKVIGSGPEERYLRSIAGPTIEFLGSVSDSELARAYKGAKALLFCALDEDFGMVPVEAMAHGTPVIALGQGGVPESVIDGKTGVLFDSPDVGKLVKAIKRFDAIYSRTAIQKACVEQAGKFGKERFQRELITFIEEKYHVHRSSSH